MFKALGILVALYTFYAATRGEVYAKSGPGGALITKEDSPTYFWIVIGVYIALSLALLIVF